MKSDEKWAEAIRILIKEYKVRRHPLEYKNVYQLLVMVVLSAQDSDANINKIAPALFEKFPSMSALAEARSEDILSFVRKVRGHNKKVSWLQDIASTVKSDEKIPMNMKELTALKGIGRKSANVIMREAGVATEGVMCDLHVVRVAPRLGITESKTPDKIEKDLMSVLPKELWTEAGISLSFLGREVCRPKNPKHDECVLSEYCWFCKEHRNGQK